jgi:hypothetical protein
LETFGLAHATVTDPKEAVMLSAAVAANLYSVRNHVTAFGDNFPIPANQLAIGTLPMLVTDLIGN